MSGGGAGGSFAGGSTTMRVAIAANLFALPSGTPPYVSQTQDTRVKSEGN
jgi:hypothetical protein